MTKTEDELLDSFADAAECFGWIRETDQHLDCELVTTPESTATYKISEGHHALEVLIDLKTFYWTSPQHVANEILAKWNKRKEATAVS